MELSIDPCLSIPLKSVALALEFSPFEWSQNLLAVGHSASVAEENENESGNKIEFNLLWECHVIDEPVCLSWSPLSTLRSIDKCLQVLIGTTAFNVTEITTDLKEENILKEVNSHKDNVNSVAYSGEGDVLFAASTSDDLQLKVWNCKSNDIVSKFLLTSPGMTVKFHPEDADFLLVGEKNGVIRVYCLSQNYARFALRNPTILSSDWSIADPYLIASAGPQGVFMWDVSEQQPVRSLLKVGGGECVSKIALCPSSADVAATISIPNSLRVICLSTNKVPIASHLKAASDISWHLQLPYLAVASDCRILLWKNDSI
ncbi:Nucleoporin Nup37 [Armadillidium nasatum]|uniref:Nucleoporin Nup37 n=1 Tax=Armadillidium nasatum TaxID=96803 RepID=A0A5N5SQK9_9CRUS|nr:Nucleoporin Nup37 [Armadillidium nasatum]